MTKRKLKGYVKPTIFFVGMSILFLSLMLMTKNMKPKETIEGEDAYVINSIIDVVTPVVETPEETKIIRPYTSDKVAVNKTFYTKDDTEEQQQNSLIYYENTYLQNSGEIYASDEEFDVVAVLDGTVVDVKQDELLNTIVYVSHNSNLTTIYYGLKDVNLKVNDTIKQKDVIGKSNQNKFCNKPFSILFEVNYNGKVLDPENFYTMDFKELN